MNHRMRGVTLIELMAVIAVLAIIASIAVPSYRTYLRRAQRADATAALLQLRAAQEKFFNQNGRYVTTDAAVVADRPGGLGLSATSEHGYYDITIAPGTAPNRTYVATATATDAQADDAQCQMFTISETGVRSSAPLGITTCWK